MVVFFKEDEAVRYKMIKNKGGDDVLSLSPCKKNGVYTGTRLAGPQTEVNFVVIGN